MCYYNAYFLGLCHKEQMSTTQSPTPNLDRPIGFLVRLAVFLVGLFAFLQVYSLQAILPTIVDDFGVAESVVGLSVGITVFAIALVSPFVGVLSDKLGRKTLIVPAIVCLAIPTALMSAVPSVDWLNLARFLQGLCVPAMTVVLLAYISEEFPQKVANLTATYVMGTVLGGFLGRFILGHLNVLIGWRSAFLLMGGLTLLGALVVGLCLPKSQNFVKSQDGGTFAKIAEHLKNPALLTLCALGGCVLFSLVGAFTFINLHLAKSPYLLGTGQLANLFSVYLIGMLITPVSAWLLGRFGVRATLFLAVGTSALGLFLTLTSPLWLIIVGLTVLSTGVFITQTATISQLSKTVTHGRSLANGLYYSGYYFGGTLGSWACGLAFVRFGWVGVVGLIFAVQLLGFGLIYQTGKNRPK